MSKFIGIIVGVVEVGVGIVTGNVALIVGGAMMIASSTATLLLTPSSSMAKRQASQTALQLGEVPRVAAFGETAIAGSLVDAFNYGGTYGTDWEALVLALADHKSEGLTGFYVNDTFVAYSGDGVVAGYNGQLEVYFRSGDAVQTLPSIVTTNGPGWSASDYGSGVTYVVVAYMADKPDAKNPVWPGGRPRFLWQLKGKRCYQARKDSTVAGGSGSHRWADPTTWEWTDNPIDCRYNWSRGIYANDQVGSPDMLLIGRGLTDVEQPPANVAAPANLCDELVGGAPQFRVDGTVQSTEKYLDVEERFAWTVGGTIVTREGAVEIEPAQAKAPSFAFTDADLLTGSQAQWNDGFLSQADSEWVNTVIPRYVEPTQKWQDHAAPVRRDVADVTADGGPREETVSLEMVKRAAQAGVIGEIRRRLGRIWGRGSVQMGPRFAAVEEGDWGTWQSDLRFGGATKTFRVEQFGIDEKWQPKLQLREIAASAFDPAAALTDGSGTFASNPTPSLTAPAASDWSLAAITVDAAPALSLTGAVTMSGVQAVVFEHRVYSAGLGDDVGWVADGAEAPSVVSKTVPAALAQTQYQTSVRYRVSGEISPRRILGPVTTGTAANDWTNISDRPIELTDGRVGSGLSPVDGYIDLSRGHFNKTVDYVLNGATYGRPLLSRLNAGRPTIDLSESIHSNANAQHLPYGDGTPVESLKPAELGAEKTTGKSLDILVNGATYGRPLLSRLNAGRPTVDFSEAIHANQNLVSNALVPATDKNRIRYSQFEAGTKGWIKRLDPVGATLSAASNNDKRAIFSTGAFAASGQQQTICTDTSGVGFWVPVRQDEWLCVQGWPQVGACPAGSTWSFSVVFLDVSGNSISGSTRIIASGAGTLAPEVFHSAFIQAPAGACYCFVEMGLTAGAAGAFTFSLYDPMLSGAIAGQTAVPSFNPGPDSEYAAEVTTGKSVDILVNGSTYGRTLLTRLNAGRPTIDLSESIHSNVNAQHVPYGDGTPVESLKPAELGAEKTTGKSLDILVNGATYGRPLLTRLNAGRPTIDFNEAIHLNQGALSKKNSVDPSTTDVKMFGSIPPTVPGQQFTYTLTNNGFSTSGSITWPTITLYRADGTTVTVSSGSQSFSGLSATSNTYKVYPYVVDNGGTTGSVSFVTSGTNTPSGTPGIFFVGTGDAGAAANMYARGNIALGGFTIFVPSSGGGSGGGGGYACLHPDMVVGDVAAGALREGDAVACPGGTASIVWLGRRRWADWLKVFSGETEAACVTPEHRFYRANGEEVRARELRLGDLLRSAGDHVEVTGLIRCDEAADLVSIELPYPHLYYAGPLGLLCHNIKP